MDYIKKIGMKAKFALRHSDVDIINSAFIPSDETVEYYTAMVKTFEKAQKEEQKAAIGFRGTQVDIATFKRGKAFLGRFNELKHLGI